MAVSYHNYSRKGSHMASAALTARLSGLPSSAVSYLREALDMAFGSGVVSIDEMGKDSVRRYVRLSVRDTSTILVVLDNENKEYCRDIEAGLYSSDKFFTYKDDSSFVEFLNDKFNTDLEVPLSSSASVSVSSANSKSYDELIQKYEQKLENKQSLINNLFNRIDELESLQFLQAEDYTSEVNQGELQEKVASLESDLATSSNMCEELNEDLAIAKKDRDALKDRVRELEEKLNASISDCQSISDELDELRVSNSRQSGVIRSKDVEIGRLKSSAASKLALEQQLGLIKGQKEDLEERVSELSSESANLKIELSSKNEELGRLRDEVLNSGNTGKLLSETQSELIEVTLERDEALRRVEDLTTRVSELEDEIDDVNEKYKTYENDLEEIKGLYSKASDDLEDSQEKVKELEARVKQDDDNIALLNKQKLDLQTELDVLEKSTSRDVDIEGLMSEIADLRRKYDKVSASVFNRVGSIISPKGSVSVRLTRGKANLKRVRFAFAGNTESRKGAYKCLLDEFKNLSKSENVVIVDAVSETSVDYVFEMKRVSSGIDWFSSGGDFRKYLSDTCLPNVKVLSPGLGYVNDGFFLTLDWESRLTELEKSGYNIVVFCGDVSNLVGRVLHEALSDFGTSIIYVHGNAIGSRTVISNLRGLSNGFNSIIAYFDFNAKMKKFYDIACRSNECRVVSIAGK